MPKPRSPDRAKAYEIYKEHGGNIENRKIAELLQIPEKTVGGWKCKDAWTKQLNGVLQTNLRSTPKRKGGQPGNKNATGPPGNKNAEKHGLFSKWLPAETQDIINGMPKDPLDILWDQIQIAYAAIIRSQQIMYVRDREDSTTTKIEDKSGNVCGERWEVQQAWDKQANFLQAQARAQKTLESLIKQYDELLHKHWELATEEQKARIAQIRAQTDRLKQDVTGQEDDGIEIVNDAPKEAD